MKRSTAGLATLTLVLGLLSSAFAGPKMMHPTAKKAAAHTVANKKVTQVTGSVLSLTPTSLTIAPTQHNKMGSRMTVGVPRSAKIVIAGHPARLASLRKGMKATITMKGGVVSSVNTSGKIMASAAQKTAHMPKKK